MKLLIVEDDPGISAAIREGLEDAGYFAEVCRDGERALRLATLTSFSAIILDVMLPGLDGINVCKGLRERRNNVPVLMLTACDTLNDRIVGLEQGADDYLCKPFEFDELLARVRALIRRDKTIKQGRFHIQDLEIDTLNRRVWRGGEEVSLTQREYTLLEALAMHEGQVLSRDAILDRVWLSEDVFSNTVDVYVKNLRKKVDHDNDQRLIHSVYGVGYVLRPAIPEDSGK